MICRSACRSARGPWAGRAFAGAIALLALAVAGSLSAQANRTAKIEEAVQSRPAGAPVVAVVSLSRQRVTVYDAGGRVMRAPVSTGKAGYETPAGIYSILQKREEHYSNLYDDASMPHMQRITWSGIALHAGPLPGYPASHGCIRMPADFAEQLFGVTRLGMRVVVMRDDIAPVDFTHPVLFKPEPQSPGPEPAPAQPDVSAVSMQGEPAAAPVQNLRALAVAKAGEAAAAKARAEAARLAAVQQSRQAARATRSLRMAQAATTRADAQLWKAERQLELAGAPEARRRAQEARAQALLQQGQARATLEKVEAEIGPVQELSARLRESARAAWKARLAADEEAKEAARKVSPISVFISRKTQRLYVRQSREPLFDSPVAIADPDEPLGTYVFTALAYANEDESALRWNAVSLYDGMPSPAPVKGRHRAGTIMDAAATDPAAAAAALDRIAIAKEAIERIAQIVSPGSSLIISDEEISRETGSGTDFIIVMSTDPQGGIAIRRRNEPVADGFRFERPFGRNPYAWGRGRSFW